MANIIDSNTIFCLRGDSYLDISSSPMTTNSNQAKFPAITNKQLVFTGNTNESSFIFSTTKTLPGDFTFEAWLNAQSYEGFNLFANRATETCFIIGHRTATETKIGTWIGPKDAWGKPSAHYFGSITMNTNIHIAYVRKGTSHYAFVNGNFVSEVTVSSPPTLGLNNFNIGQASNFKVWNVRISNVARYTKPFTPDPNPYTSVAISEFSYTDGALNLVVTKNTNETINKIEVLVNGVIVKTYNNQTLNFGDTIAIEDFLIYGNNTIEAKAYYYDDNHYVSKSISVKKSIEKLTNTAAFEDIMNYTNEIKSNISSMNDLLAATLTAKGITTGSDPKMFHLIKLVGQMSNVNSSEVTGYLNQISELTSQNNLLTSQLSNKNLEIENNKLALANALIAKNLPCTQEDSFETLLSYICDLKSYVPKVYLYNEGDQCINITGGFSDVFQYNYGSTNNTVVQYNADHIYIKATGVNSADSYRTIYTVKSLNLQSYTKLYIEYEVISISSAGSYGGIGLDTNRSYIQSGTSNSEVYKSIGITNPSINKGVRLTKSMDITSGSTLVYPYINITTNGYSAYYLEFKVYKLWVE